MSQEIKMQEELKKAIANTDETVASEELSDEQLDAVAGGLLVCKFVSRVPNRLCIFNSRVYSAQ
jgi:hypothetical protein